MDIINPITWTNGMLTYSSVLENDYPVWSNSALYAEGAKVIIAATHKIYECLLPHQSSAGSQSTVTISAAAPGVVSWASHGLVVNTPVVFTTTGTLPVGLSLDTIYYVLAPAAGTFNVSLNPNGVPITTTTIGTGVHTAIAANTSPTNLSNNLWLDLGATNKYKFVDEKFGTQTTATVVTATATISIASPCVVTYNSHGLTTNDVVVFTTTDTLPTGLQLDTIYYASVLNANTFNLRVAPGGAFVNTTLAGVGTHSVVKPLVLNISPGTPIDSLAALNLIGSKVLIKSNLGTSVIYENAIALQTDVGVYDWLTYFTANIVAQDDVVVTNLLPYGTQVITIAILATGTAAIGSFAIGAYTYIGSLQRSPKISIIDYTVKSVDEYGFVTVTERPYSKRYSCTIAVKDNFVDQLASILASIRAVPVVWVGSGNDYSSLIVLGFFKDFEIDINNQIMSYCTLTIEGLV